MVWHFLVEGLPVWVWRQAFTPAECARLATDPPWPEVTQQIVPNQERASRYGELFLSRMVGGEGLPRIAGWTPHVTYTRSTVPIAWHKDSPRGASFKTYVYLNDAPGTRFSRGENRLVTGEQGTLVLFDIRLEHCGAPADARRAVVKQLLGLRPLTPDVAVPADD